MKLKFYISILLLCAGLMASESPEIKLQDAKKIYLTGIDYTFRFALSQGRDSLALQPLFSPGLTGEVGRPSYHIDSARTQMETVFRFPSSGTWIISGTSGGIKHEVRVIPGWFSLLPPLIAILLALLTRQVLIALFSGIWFGAAVIFDYNPFHGFLEALTGYIGKAPAEPERIAILIFSLTLGGMVGVISKSGGTQGIIQKLSRHATSPRTGQLATWFMGILIFFDDYANTLIVGNTMRPLTDRLRISREKLAYLVDSTAAPVATIAIISTWIGYQLSLITDAFRRIGIDDNAYITFFRTIPYNFYPIFTLIFGFFIAYLQRDLFSMYRAEKRAGEKGELMRKDAIPLADLSSDELSPKKGIALRWYNALIPILTVIFSTLAGLWLTGLQAVRDSGMTMTGKGSIHYLSTIIGQANSFDVLMWAAFLGSFMAIILAVVQRLLTLNEALLAWVGGVKAMVMAALILTLAWAIGNICTDIQTAEYVITITSGLLSPHFLPMLSFLIAGVIAFSTGTSWGTMAILTPIVIPLAYQLPLDDVLLAEATRNSIFLSSIASILAGATFGDHCSPISDTTIMSSMASGSDHIDHVRTQLPYAVIVAAISILLGYIPAGFGFHPLMGIVIGFVAVFLLIRFAGRRA